MCESCGNGGVGSRGEPASLRAPVVGAGLPPVLNNEQDLGRKHAREKQWCLSGTMQRLVNLEF